MLLNPTADAVTGPVGNLATDVEAPAKHLWPLVGFVGVARSGKDTAAAGLERMGFKGVAFADALKADLVPLANGLGLDPFNDEHKAMLRPLMVEWGRLSRRVDPDHWITRLWMPCVPVAVKDVRYPNEARRIVSWGGILIGINRPGFGAANEEERSSIAEIKAIQDPGWPGVSWVDNDSTIPAVQAYVRLLVERHFGRERFPVASQN